MIHGYCLCIILVIGSIRGSIVNVDGHPHRILLDTDVDTDDLFALLYILKLDRSIFDLQISSSSPSSFLSCTWINQNYKPDPCSRNSSVSFFSGIQACCD